MARVLDKVGIRNDNRSGGFGRLLDLRLACFFFCLLDMMLSNEVNGGI